MKFILIKLALIISLFSISLGGVTCNYCKQEITGKYLTQNSNSYHEKCYKDNVALKCSHCLKVLEGEYVSLDSKSYHEKCYKDNVALKCSHCLKVLEGEYVSLDSKSYHEKCYKENIIPKCTHCLTGLEGEYVSADSGLYHKSCYSGNAIPIGDNTTPNSMSQPKCNHCLENLEGQYISVDSKSYHERCYRENVAPKCGHCNKPLSGQYVSNDSGSYHENCYRNFILPKCVICNYPLDGRYNIDPWGNEFHSDHITTDLNFYSTFKGIFDNNCPGQCSSCGRIVSDQTSKGGFVHKDDRVICNICNKQAILKSEIENSRTRVLKILQEQGFTGLSDTVPIILVNLNELLEIKGGGSRGIKGLTDYQYSYVTNGAGDIVKENKKYAIYILDKLPKIYFDSVLAHEYLHVWLFENKQDYKSSITEGFCNLGAFAIYNSVNDKFSEIQLENMNQNPDPDYGVGYRTMKKCLDQKGWTDLINEVGSGNATKSCK